MTVLEADITAAARRIARIRSVSDLDAARCAVEPSRVRGTNEAGKSPQRLHGGLGEAIRENPAPTEEGS